MSAAADGAGKPGEPAGSAAGSSAARWPAPPVTAVTKVPGARRAQEEAEAQGRRDRRRGGLAGLAAAREIDKAGKSVVVLEARKRVGGRTLNHDIGGGEIVEIGGQWVGPTQNHVPR